VVSVEARSSETRRRSGGALITAFNPGRMRYPVHATRLNWRLSHSWLKRLLQNGHKVSVAECIFLLLLAAEQLRQRRVVGSFFSTTQEFS
jgi:hypothetical protein